jgi:hypothetical protein
MNRFYKLILLCFAFGSCIDPPDYPVEPEIEYLGLSKVQMVQDEFNTDSTFIFFSFTDGDGDLGSDDSLNVFLIDTRDNFIANRYRLPYFPEEGANNGVSGEVTLKIFTTCCIYPTGQAPCTPSDQFPFDTVSYRIYIKDRAGHKSNEIVTEPILIECR